MHKRKSVQESVQTLCLTAQNCKVTQIRILQLVGK